MAGLADCSIDSLDLRGDWGQAQFSIEIADTEAERAQGLMHRSHMPRRAGMLFIYDRPQQVAFWMKNTLIPLDMIFVDRTGVVQKVHSNAIPGDLTPIQGGKGIIGVLEINGGVAESYGIGPGTQLRHNLFDQSTAIWPC